MKLKLGYRKNPWVLQEGTKQGMKTYSVTSRTAPEVTCIAAASADLDALPPETGSSFYDLGQVT